MVIVREDDTAALTHTELLEQDGPYTVIRSAGGKCDALSDGPPWRCSIYPDRPNGCKVDLIPGDAGCIYVRGLLGID